MRNSLLLCFLVVFVMFLSFGLSAQYAGNEEAAGDQDVFKWPEGIRCAVSLSFDDGRETQVDKGVPLLNKYGVKATFYVRPDRIKNGIEKWKQAAADGHELANHTVNHPCSGNFPFARNRALENHTLEMMKEEMLRASSMIKALTGISPKTFAYPCGQKYVGRGLGARSYVPLVAEHFLSGRGWLDEHSNNPAFCDLAQITGVKIDQLSFAEMKREVEETAELGFWLVWAGHDIGPEGTGLLTFESELAKLCQWMKDPANGIWVGTVGEITEYVIRHRSDIR